MAGVLKNVFGGAQPSNAASEDGDFADFVKAPEPSPAPIVESPSTPFGQVGAEPVPYTKWYRVWERTSPKDFMQEAMVMPIILLIVIFHFWGTRKNRRRATEWATAHATALRNEFAVVGFDGISKSEDAVSVELTNPKSILKERSPQEFSAYATGRQNVAFLDVAIKMPKRANPVTYYMDQVFAFFFDSWPAPEEHFEATAYTFDGKEKDLVPVPGNDTSSLKVNNSTHDGFIFAIVHKNHMRNFRNDRYDASMTFTKDNAKLPQWVTVMTENAEITETLLTPELIQAVEQAGHNFKYLIVTDQPVDKPTKIEETTPRKRVQLCVPLASSAAGYASTLPLFNQYLRLPDRIVTLGHFRPEVMRKIRNVREEEIKKLRRLDEQEKAEERKLAAEKLKKEERERTLRGMNAEEQRKYLEREAQKEQRRSMKKNTRRA
ncbi:CCDC47 family protein [Aspergillus undulatus]|uniref:CCDC47 family protein n=1 Tax=Aspergillus undulatus TaxID=1810928 RepID=UPI003CCD4065